MRQSEKIVDKDRFNSVFNQVIGYILNPELTIENKPFFQDDLELIHDCLKNSEQDEIDTKQSFNSHLFLYDNTIQYIKTETEKKINYLCSFIDSNYTNNIEKLKVFITTQPIEIQDIKILDQVALNCPALMDHFINTIPNNNIKNEKTHEKYIEVNCSSISNNNFLHYLINDRPEAISYFFNLNQQSKNVDSRYHNRSEQYKILCLALDQGTETFKNLINQGFDINAYEYFKYRNKNKHAMQNNCLTHALKTFSKDKIKAVLEAGFDYKNNPEMKGKNNPYNSIFIGYWCENCQVLSNYGIQPDETWINRKIRNNEKGIDSLIDNVAFSSINLEFIIEFMPEKLNRVLKQEQNNTDQLLNPEKTNILGQTLNYAHIGFETKEKVFWQLVQAGADINHPNIQEYDNGQIVTQTHLLEQIAMTPFIIKDNIFDYVLSQSKNFLFEQEKEGNFSLVEFVQTPEYLKKMLDTGFNPNQPDRYKKTPLMYVVSGIQQDSELRNVSQQEKQGNLLESFQLLLQPEYKTDLEIRDKSRETALFKVNNPHTLDQLLNAGAKHNIKNRKKEKPIDVLNKKSQQIPELKNRLEQFIFNKQTTDNPTQQPIKKPKML